jgi:hypothetical protein
MKVYSKPIADISEFDANDNIMSLVSGNYSTASFQRLTQKLSLRSR